MGKASTIVFYDEDNKLLLQHRTNDAPVMPNYWSFFGGQIEEGETPEKTILREIKEEINYALENPEFFTRKKFILEGKQHEEFFFIEKCKNKKGLVLREGKDWGWFSPKETKGLKMNEEDRKVVKLFAEKLNPF